MADEEPLLTESTTALSPRERLLRDLSGTWKEAESRGINETSYISLINRTFKRKGLKHQSKPCFFKCFDSLWTILLLITIAILLVVYIPPVNKALQTHLHDKIYSIQRLMRFAFLSVHPYLLYFNIDMTQVCLIPNPLVNTTMYCPCMRQMAPTEVHTKVLNNVLLNSPTPHVIRQGININNITYGRETLLKYVRVHGVMPSQCMPVTLGQHEPYSIDQIIDEEKWKRLETLPWGFMWHDCDDAPPLLSLLPKLTINDDSTEIHQYGVYSLITLWEKSVHYDIQDDNNNASVVMILGGKVNVKVEPLHHCMSYCIAPIKGILLEEGDMFVYDRRYWTYSIQSWSDIAFAMKITLNASSQLHTANRNEL